MKKLIYLFLFSLVFCGSVHAQNHVAFEIDKNGGVASDMPVSMIETNTARLLTAINNAEAAKSKELGFSGINMTDDAKNSLAQMWANVHFKVMDDDIFQKCISLKANGRVRGYEVANIAIEMIPMNDEYKESRTQEITISYNKGGTIDDIVISMGKHQYTSLMKGAVTLDDYDRRMQILHYVEQFRTAYCQKDMTFLDNVFSDDALIITGKRTMNRVKDGRGMVAKTEYTKQSKADYLAGLAKAFKKNKYINVKFDEIEVENNPLHTHMYGVTLKQKWNSSTYSDEGIVFLLWDFSNEEAPKIYVRTWQYLDDPNRFKTTDFEF